MRKLLALLVTGALAGLAATAPMTLVMESLRRKLPRGRRRALAPSEITTNFLGRVGWLAPLVQRRRHRNLTFLAHFGYGAGAGSLYAPVAVRVPSPAVAKGIVYGILVWAVSYLGILPALGLFPSAAKDQPQRQALMVAGHVVWGAVLGWLSDAIAGD